MPITTRFYFLSKVRYTKQLNDGTFKRVSEKILLTASTYGEAEELTYKYFDFVRGEFSLQDLKRVNFEDIIYGPVDEESVNDSIFVLAKVNMLLNNFDSPKQKTVTYKYLLRVAEFGNYEELLKEFLENTGQEYEIDSVSIYPIVDIYDNLNSEIREEDEEDDYQSDNTEEFYAFEETNSESVANENQESEA